MGVVHNAVDAQLAGSDQIELSWSAEGMRQVAALLRMARDAGRVVVVTGDHGHIVEDGNHLTAGGVGDRWRRRGRVADGEIALSGGRVISPDWRQRHGGGMERTAALRRPTQRVSWRRKPAGGSDPGCRLRRRRRLRQAGASVTARAGMVARCHGRNHSDGSR